MTVRYLTELDYEQAIAEFQAVLSIDGNCEEAYYGLVEAYKGVLDDIKVVDRDDTYNKYMSECEAYENYFRNRIEKYPNVAGGYYGAAVFAIIKGDFFLEDYRFEQASNKYSDAKEIIAEGESKLGEAKFLEIKAELETKSDNCEYERNRVHEIGFGIEDFSIFGITIDSDDWNRDALSSKLSVFPYGYDNVTDYCYDEGADDSLIVWAKEDHASFASIFAAVFSKKDDGLEDRAFKIDSYGKDSENGDIYIGTSSYFIASPIKLKEDTHNSILDKLCNGDEELKQRLEGYVPWEIVINTQYGIAEHIRLYHRADE